MVRHLSDLQLFTVSIWKYPSKYDPNTSKYYGSHFSRVRQEGMEGIGGKG